MDPKLHGLVVVPWSIFESDRLKYEAHMWNEDF